MRPLNVVIGAGNTQYDGWLSTNINVFDITTSGDWKKLFKTDSIDRLLAEHVFEHLSEGECEATFRYAYRYLKRGGLLRVAVPDGYRRDKKYSDYVSPPKDGHKTLFNVDMLSSLLVSSGFVVTLLEYFDAEEKFHSLPWDDMNGYIQRSFKFDKREYFKHGDVFYTSLIIDAKKPGENHIY